MPEAANAPDIEPRRGWGLIDIPIGIVVGIGVSIVGVVVGSAFSSGFEASDDSIGGAALVLSTLGFQLGLGGWAWFVSSRRGRGPAVDYRLAGRELDLVIGFVATLVLFPAAIAVNWVVSRMVGIDFGSEESGNTELLTDVRGATLFFVLVSAVIVAPLVEELFFRGLCLRAIERRFGTTAAVLGSTVLFVVPHFTFSTLEGTAVLFSQIFVVGLILALLTVRFDRLGPAIVTHMLFNLVGALAAVSTMA